MGRILVTGGAGYIGSHIVRLLVEVGRETVVLDDLSEGHRAAVRGARLVVSDFADPATLAAEIEGGVDFIVHMAAFCEVGRSVEDPASYYHNNVVRTLALLDAARRGGVRGIVFSSSAATYGEPRELPIPESHPQEPTNPYGETKLAVERALRWHYEAYGLRFATLRYFNAAGAHPDGTLGEDHAEESHLIPRLLCSVRDGGEPVPIHGDDYPTADGTCVRDYVHVMDLAAAHLLALEAMERGELQQAALNLGNGAGFSVRQVVDAVAAVTGRRPATRVAPRRRGDPAALVASSALAERTLGWRPRHAALDSIVATAWNWHRLHPGGYGEPAG